jgi:hypothetical protein
MKNVQELSQYISKEFLKLGTNIEKRNFIENFSFLMMSNDIDFENFYSHKSLNKTEFYSIADMLYQLNNFWILSEFLHQNRQILLTEVDDIIKQAESPDFYTPCRLGQDTIFARIFKVFESHSANSANLYAVAEDTPPYSSCIHKLKVYSATQSNSVSVSQIILQGKWVEKFGFSIGSNIRVECHNNRLIITKESP